MVAAKRGLTGLVSDAQKRSEDFDRKHGKQIDPLVKTNQKVESSLKTFYKEFRKVVDAADVVLEVLDARDPLGSRCKQMEETILSSGTGKRLVLVLNKIDLVPKENVEAWIKHLKNEFPTVAFKASTQIQNDNLSRRRVNYLNANEDMIKSSPCLGADILMKLLANYCRNKDIKTAIRVGVVGFPNTGKSSIINSLKRGKACNVGSTPGVTKQMQEVLLDKHIRLLDSPGVVMATGTSDTSIILRNCVKIETLQDPSTAVEAILRRCNKEQMMLHYGVKEYSNVSDFLSLLAVRLGRLKKGGIPDVTKAARTVLQDWNSGRITYYTHPPEQDGTHVSSQIVQEMGKEFDIDSLLSEQQKVIDGLKHKSVKHMLVESLGPAEIIMRAEDIDKMANRQKKKQHTKSTTIDESDEEEEMADEEELEDEEDLADMDEAEEMEEEQEEPEELKATVSLPTSASRSRTSSRSSMTAAKVDTKIQKLNPGLPQMNKARKVDFKKMKKQRKRRDKVAGDLSDALTKAFS